MEASNYIIQKKDLKSASLYAPGWIIFGAISVYIFLSFYEVFAPGGLSLTKYYLIPLAVFVLFSYRTVRIKYYHFIILAWLGLKFVSVLWAWNGVNKVVTTNVMSQVSMTAMFIILTLVDYEEKWANRFIIMIEGISFSQGVLSLFYAQPYIPSVKNEIEEGRNVLTLLGEQNDPNNQAAFLVIAVAIALYFIFAERKQILLNSVIVIVNAYATIQTGSRGGLVALIGICVVMLFIPSTSEKKMPVYVRISIVSIFIGVIFFVASSYADSIALERVFELAGADGGSGRTDIWTNALELVSTSPILGTGWGSYYGYNGLFSVAHNTFIENLCSTGIVGTILLFTPLVIALVIGIRRKKYIVIPIIVAGMLPCIFLDAANKRFFWNAFFFAMMIAESVSEEKDEYGRSAGHRSMRGYLSRHISSGNSKYIK